MQISYQPINRMMKTYLSDVKQLTEVQTEHQNEQQMFLFFLGRPYGANLV